jgi:hypothetical protein
VDHSSTLCFSVREDSIYRHTTSGNFLPKEAVYIKTEVDESHCSVVSCCHYIVTRWINLPCWGADSADGRDLVQLQGTHCLPLLRRRSTDQDDLYIVQTCLLSSLVLRIQPHTFRHSHYRSCTIGIEVGNTHAQVTVSPAQLIIT